MNTDLFSHTHETEPTPSDDTPMSFDLRFSDTAEARRGNTGSDSTPTA